MTAYFIIGIIIFTYTTIRMANEREDPVGSMFSHWEWWLATVICVITWPAIVLWAVHDAIKELKEEGLV